MQAVASRQFTLPPTKLLLRYLGCILPLWLATWQLYQLTAWTSPAHIVRRWPTQWLTATRRRRDERHSAPNGCT
ncbi:hypothetical protein C8F01DRAFT_1156342 [Mycena amicta]|nr:hypothetical protein C8F01DRAFT_1156342 [Mycena amicta]